MQNIIHSTALRVLSGLYRIWDIKSANVLHRLSFLFRNVAKTLREAVTTRTLLCDISELGRLKRTPSRFTYALFVIISLIIFIKRTPVVYEGSGNKANGTKDQVYKSFKESNPRADD